MKLRTMLPVGAAAITSLLLAAAPTMATNASETLTAGTLGFATTPGGVTFPNTALNGQDKNVTVRQPLDIADATGSGAGWNITATSTQFKTTGGNTLPLGAVTVASAPTASTCDTGVTCTVAGNSITFPYVLPSAAGTGPTATKLYNATANTGMGDQTVSPTWTLAIPGNAYAGNYNSTWTLSLVSGP